MILPLLLNLLLLLPAMILPLLLVLLLLLPAMILPLLLVLDPSRVFGVIMLFVRLSLLRISDADSSKKHGQCRCCDGSDVFHSFFLAYSLPLCSCPYCAVLTTRRDHWDGRVPRRLEDSHAEI